MSPLLFFISLCLLSCITSNAQTISDSEFQWVQNKDCPYQGTSLEIFVKVEHDPILTLFNKEKFKESIQRTIQNIGLTKNQNEIIKLKLLFARNQNLCLKDFAFKNLALSPMQVEEFLTVFNAIDQFDCWKQRNMEVDCQGILSITIQNR